MRATVVVMLILASASPRRHELLRQIGIEHLVCPANVPEIRQPSEAPEDFVRRLAAEKARAVICEAGDIVLGADTIVRIDDAVLGKPKDDNDARSMLRRLSGRRHEVQTGICLRSPGREIQDVATTLVFFAPLSDAESEAYLRTGEGNDKAGSYAIQGLAARFITSIEGCYSNVIGLPLPLVYRYLRDWREND